MKKTKQPGDNFSLKTKKTEDPAIMKWINSQSNLMDSLRYLIENEIVQNGIRNLQAVVPAERNVLSSSLSAEGGTVHSAPGREPFREAISTVIDARNELAAAQAEEIRLAEPAPESIGEEEIDDEDIESWV